MNTPAASRRVNTADLLTYWCSLVFDLRLDETLLCTRYIAAHRRGNMIHTSALILPLLGRSKDALSGTERTCHAFPGHHYTGPLLLLLLLLLLHHYSSV